jgi:hypothetical protein
MTVNPLSEHPLCRRVLGELARTATLSFADLGRTLEAPYARLSAATLALKDAGWIASEVNLVGTRLRMEYRLTWQGRAVLAARAPGSTGRAAHVA